MNPYLVIVLATLVGFFLLDSIARHFNDRALSPELPDEFKDVFDATEYRKSQEYTRVQGRLEQFAATVELALLLAVILLGGFGIADSWARSFGFGEISTGLIFFAIVWAVYEICSLPLTVYSTFVVEKRFGFNRTTPGLFLRDRIRSYIISAIFLGLLLGAILFFFLNAGSTAWLWIWIFSALLILGVQYIFPIWILPLFNKFTPLPQGELRESLDALARSQNIALSDVYLMDGSKRSTKSNAFFTGFGRHKRIALFDTLTERLDTAEITAVMAHEIGHWRLGHVKKMTITAICKMGLLFFIMSLFLHTPELPAAFGLAPSIHAGLLCFIILFTPVSRILAVLGNVISRRYEFQADAFAAKACETPTPLISGLKKLCLANLANLTPHPLLVFLHYSHPPVLQRIDHLKKL
ncbi:MAG: M48 family metallopeptidase [Desulfovibrio sp.]|uniref:M48 family metallopeptidase n=1 Tax=Desulfovibrio sp. 7SRBS1 TaxID=3378064 RepID=UPI003B400E49